ncbi:hypothetical protein MHUMG1_06667 [Metarhizium humberi]|uniref:Uncharacterized protein n=1 Tax=Metarhizium humberi TaxID=2596975 RepID=A0A9P8M844_9HYPO|nr:hypothetical protein MHUMG1_06667 [Metarhizium humberi]
MSRSSAMRLGHGDEPLTPQRLGLLVEPNTTYPTLMRQLDLLVQENNLNPESSDPGSWVVSGVITTQQLSHRGGPEQTVVLSDLPPRQAQDASHARKSYNTA